MAHLLADILQALRPFLSDEEAEGLAELADLDALVSVDAPLGLITVEVLAEAVPEPLMDDETAAPVETLPADTPPAEAPLAETQPPPRADYVPWLSTAKTAQGRAAAPYPYKVTEHLELRRSGPPISWEPSSRLTMVFPEEMLGKGLASQLFPAAIEAGTLRQGIAGIGLHYHPAAAMTLWRWELQITDRWPFFRQASDEADPAMVNRRDDAMLAFMREEDADALAVLEQINWAFPKDLVLQMTRGLLLAFTADDLENGLRCMRVVSTLAENPHTRAYARFHEAQGLFRWGRFDECYPTLERCLVDWPGLALFEYWLAKVAFIVGEEETGLKAVRSLLAKDLTAAGMLFADEDFASAEEKILDLFQEMNARLVERVKANLQRINVVVGGKAMTPSGVAFHEEAVKRLRDWTRRPTPESFLELRALLDDTTAFVRESRAYFQHFSGGDVVRDDQLPGPAQGLWVTDNGARAIVDLPVPLILDTASTEVTGPLRVPTGWSCAAICPDRGERYALMVLTDGKTHRIGRWSLPHNELTGNMQTLEGFNRMALSPDGAHLACSTGYEPTQLFLLESVELKPLRNWVASPPTGVAREVFEERILWANDRLVAVLHEKGFKLYDIKTETPVTSWTGKIRPYRSGFAGNGRYLLTQSVTEVIVFDCQELRTVARLPHYRSSVLLGTPNGRFVALCTEETSAKGADVHLYETTDWEEVAINRNPRNDIGCAAFTADSQTLVVGSFDHTVRFFDVPTLQETGQMTLPDRVRELVLSPDGLMAFATYGHVQPDNLASIELQRHLQSPQVVEALRKRALAAEVRQIEEELSTGVDRKAEKAAAIRGLRERKRLCLVCGRKLTLVERMSGQKHCQEHQNMEA